MQLLELWDKVQKILDWCVEVALSFHHPSPLLMNVAKDGAIMGIFKQNNEQSDKVVVPEKTTRIK